MDSVTNICIVKRKVLLEL